MKKKKLGIDEAGRGCIIGPLCLCGVVTEEKGNERLLKEWGCKDSKRYGSSSQAREERMFLAEKIRKEFPYFEEIISAETIDDYVVRSSLNLAESDHAQKILGQADFDFAVLDGKNIFKCLETEKICAENKADDQHLCVAAASILAKDLRDSLLEKIFADLNFPPGLPGGGYVNSKTLSQVKGYFVKHKKLPPEFRRSYRWKKLFEEIPEIEKGFYRFKVS